MSAWRCVVSAFCCSDGCYTFWRRRSKMTFATETLVRAPLLAAAKNGAPATSPTKEILSKVQFDFCTTERHRATPTCEADLAAGVPSGSLSIMPSAKRRARPFEFDPHSAEIRELEQGELTRSLQGMRLRHQFQVCSSGGDGGGLAGVGTQMAKLETPPVRQFSDHRWAPIGSAQEARDTSQTPSVEVLRLALCAEEEAFRELDSARLTMRDTSRALLTKEPKVPVTTEPDATCATVKELGASWATPTSLPTSLRPKPLHHQKVHRATTRQGKAWTQEALGASSMSVRRDREAGIIDETTVDPEILEEHPKPPRKHPPRPAIYLEAVQIAAIEIGGSPDMCFRACNFF